MTGDMSEVIIPKSDQWNYDDFLSGPITFVIKAVRVKGGQEQPVDIAMEGTNKFYRPCKSMARVMVSAWGSDSAKYVGRSMTLYGDPKIKWGGMEVGGIRISHMSHIDSAMNMMLTVTRANKKPFTVKPLKIESTNGAPSQSSSAGSPPIAERAESPPSTDGADTITPDQALALEAMFDEHQLGKLTFFTKAEVTLGRKIQRFSQIPAADYERTVAYVNAAIAKRKAEAT